MSFFLSFHMLQEQSVMLLMLKQKRSQLCIRPRYKRIQHVWQDSAASSQTTHGYTGQWSITLLIAVPRLITIPAASLAEAEQCRADCNSSNSATMSLICESTVFRSMSQLYHCILRENQHNSDNDSIPRWPAIAVALGLDHQISPQILLRSSEQIKNDRGKDSLTVYICLRRQVSL